MYALIGCIEDDTRPNIEVLREDNDLNFLVILKGLIGELEHGETEELSDKTQDILNYIGGFVNLFGCNFCGGDADDYTPKITGLKVIRYEVI